jgi:hypothetical protein
MVSDPMLGAVVTWQAPEGEKLSTDYQLWANDQPVGVYKARVLDPPFAGKEYNYGGDYSFANFDMEGDVTVRIKSSRLLRNAVVRPNASDVRLKVVDDHTCEIRLQQPRKFSFEPDGKNGPLLLFGNALEKNVPKQGDPNVIFFGRGIHASGKVTAKSGQTVYLAGGAIVKGAIVAEGSDIRIRGRGILDSSEYEWRKGPHGVVLGVYGTNIEVEGITIRGASHWTIVPTGSRKVTVRNVKLCNSRVQNDDGINPCNTQEVLITDCFIRSDDDCVAMKG